MPISQLVELPSWEIQLWAAYAGRFSLGAMRHNIHAAVIAREILRVNLARGGTVPDISAYMVDGKKRKRSAAEIDAKMMAYFAGG